MMDYNDYYLAPAGQPPPLQTVMMSNQHDCSMMGGQMMLSNGPTMMHSPAPSTTQSIRHTPWPPPMAQQPQQPQHHQKHMGHPMTSRQQPSPHPNYHQLPYHPPMSHSASPHPPSTPHAQPQAPPRPGTGPSPLHHQSPIHMNVPSPKIQTHGHMSFQTQSSNHMSSVISSGLPHAPTMPGNNHLPQHQHHGHSFSSSPMPQHSNPHYGQPQPVNHLSHPNMNHGPPPKQPTMQSGPGLGRPPPSYVSSNPKHRVNQERGSPFSHQHIPQTEFRILELNKRLQNRLPMRGPPTPLPVQGSSDEANWWERLICDFFDDDSTLTLRIPGEGKPKEWKIGRALVPRFFRSYFKGGITDLSIKPRVTKETSRSPGFITLDCDQADIITKHIFKQPGTNFMGSVVVYTEGHLSLDFVSNNCNDQLLIKSWRFYANQCHEYIDRSVTNTGHPNEYINKPVTHFGLTKSTLMYLRMCMVMEPMQELMAHHIQTKRDPKSCLKDVLHDQLATLPESERVSEISSPKRDVPIENHEEKESNGLVEKASPSLSETKSPDSDVVTVEPVEPVVVTNNLDTPPKDEESCNGDTSRPVSEEPSEKENNGFILNEDDSIETRKDNHPNVMSSIPEDREDNGKLSPCDSIVAKLPPKVNNKLTVQTNGNGSKQNRRRSSERKETLREGLMRTLDFVIAIKDLKTDHPSSLWRITGNNLLQQFEPKIQNGIVLYESTNQYAGWNTEIRRDYIGVDVKVTHYNRHHLTVERLLLNLQNIEELESFQDLHFSIYLQILISNVLDPLFGEGLQENPQHLDYYLPSRKIIEDIIKRHKSKILSKLKLNETTIKNFEKYPSLIINPIVSLGQSHMCRACNTNSSTQVVNFGNMSYDLHSYKPVKVTSEPTKVDDKNQQNHLCDDCLNLAQLYSEIHHMGWKLTNIARDKVTPLQLKGKSVRTIIEDCMNDDEWMRDNFEKRDMLWSKIERL